jgi:hypothetical protein
MVRAIVAMTSHAGVVERVVHRNEPCEVMPLRGLERERARCGQHRLYRGDSHEVPGYNSRFVSLLPFCEWLASTRGSIALHESLYTYPLVESVHVLTLCLFVGMSVMLDLRLLGIALRRVPVSEMTDRLVPWMVAGFVVMIITGILLFYAIPIRSYQNIFFRLKLIALLLAGANAWVFHNGVQRSVARWDLDLVPPRKARFAGAASLALWALIIVCGRMIAYNWFDCDMPQPPLVKWAAGCVDRER